MGEDQVSHENRLDCARSAMNKYADKLHLVNNADSEEGVFMRRDIKNSLFLFVLVSLWLSVSSTMCQTKRVAEAIKKIPLEGRTSKDFAPKGWEVYNEASGDLNGDNLPDAALTLTLPIEEAEKLKEAGGDEYESAPSIIVILFRKPDGGFKRYAVNGRLYPPD